MKIPAGETKSGTPVYATYSGPKDTSVDEITFEATPDGIRKLSVKKAVTKMNPDVVTTSGAVFNQALQTAAQTGVEVAKFALMAKAPTNAVPITTNSPTPPQ